MCTVGASCEPGDCRWLGSVAIDGVSGQRRSFALGASLPEGCYRLEYVQGAYLTREGRFAAGTYLYSDGERVGERIAGGTFPTPTATRNNWEGTEVEFRHCGGEIAVGNGDFPDGFGDNAQGLPNPIWRLYACDE